MSVYAIVQLRIHDPALYGRYMKNFIARFDDVFGKFGGKMLAADDAPRVLEGEWWDRNKVVLMEFPDTAAFTAWATSPEYNEIASDRVAGAEAVVLLVKGMDRA
ncbi:MAG: DUF1330 domain-containing protein [Hyphomonadaceae bacterium]|nr:DUF1330 domain-containing protein [Hyphomonadaceae bacterium]MCA8885182.1 DUF1330 domain-containing protein [Hyphomonadaceae bacterium]